jgi:hypothetical protein
MLSLPDFREKQILFVRAEKDLDNKLHFKNDNLTFVKDGKIVNQLSCYKICPVTRQAKHRLLINCYAVASTIR